LEGDRNEGTQFILIFITMPDIPEKLHENSVSTAYGKVKGKVHPCTDTEARYMPYGP